MPLAEACDAACRIRVAEYPFIAVCAMVYATEYRTPFGRVKMSSKELLQRRSVLRKSEKRAPRIADYHGLSYAKYDLRLTDRAFSALGAQKHKEFHHLAFARCGNSIKKGRKRTKRTPQKN